MTTEFFATKSEQPIGIDIITSLQLPIYLEQLKNVSVTFTWCRRQAFYQLQQTYLSPGLYTDQTLSLLSSLSMPSHIQNR